MRMLALRSAPPLARSGEACTKKGSAALALALSVAPVLGQLPSVTYQVLSEGYAP